ncbi:LacI family DNA-binding transcriptional regulator [Propylenella binzhouense]|uniref:LacI family transcriptional regulator n=1 Tax=Propylenella binzhouense TaxID=2555902 RepID=A0A964T4Z8_9HYPH|nr:LacI family DNA-binding transcriptional regulator [Propylenella binzhouense]MYZ48611.1 LacI family transcriptional regulator [Propylenella binzhouense]
MASDTKEAPGHPRKVGIKDIARAANVSTTAVSYALNGTGRLDEQTRLRVIRIADQIGYRVNRNALNLRRRKSGVLAIAASVPEGLSSVLPSMDFFMQIWHGAVAASLKRGYMLLLIPFGTAPKDLETVPVDGGIVIDPVANDPLVGHFEANGLPYVTIGRDAARDPEPAWWVDNDHGTLALQAFRHLKERGARRIGLILAAPSYAYTVATRAAYLDWIAQEGGEPLMVVVEEAPTSTAGYNAALAMLDSPKPPDAIYAAIDRFAVGTLFAAAARGISVPQDLKIVSGNDGILTRTAHIPITAIDLVPNRLGREAIEMLLDRIEGAASDRHLILNGRIEVRASS